MGLTRMRAVRAGAAVLAMAGAFALLGGTPGSADAVRPAGSLLHSIVSIPRTFGVAEVDMPYSMSRFDAVSRALGRTPNEATIFFDWGDSPDFPAKFATRLAARDTTLEVTWMSRPNSAATTVPVQYTDAAIAAGSEDTYLLHWASEIKAFGRPVVLRLDPEMNGDWEAWSPGNNGNTADSFVAMWQHVVTLFRNAGATNVIWSWSPNVPRYMRSSLPSVYPGAAYVDRVGLDGYNWGTTQTPAADGWQSRWESFAQTFRYGITHLKMVAPSKPIYIEETASTSQGGSKAAWIRAMWAYLDAHPAIRGITWFDDNKETDWSLDSSAASRLAAKAGITAYLAE